MRPAAVEALRGLDGLDRDGAEVFGDSGHALREPKSDRIRRDLLDFLWSWVGLLGAERPTAPAGASPDAAAPADRVTWTPNADGSVRQLWEKSADGGATWTTAFDGLYTRAGAGGR
jgi:hypothetical protein